MSIIKEAQLQQMARVVPIYHILSKIRPLGYIFLLTVWL